MQGENILIKNQIGVIIIDKVFRLIPLIVINIIKRSNDENSFILHPERLWIVKAM